MNWLGRSLSCKPNIYVSWSTSELRVRLAPFNQFKPSSKIFYWLFQGSTSFVELLCVFFLSCVCYVFLSICLYVLCGHLLGKGWPLDSGLWCLTLSLSLSHWYLGQVWYLIVSIPDLCTLTYLALSISDNHWFVDGIVAFVLMVSDTHLIGDGFVKFVWNASKIHQIMHLWYKLVWNISFLYWIMDDTLKFL